MVTIANPSEYWLLRMASAIEDADRARTERARNAYLELAGHYSSMHELVNGRSAPAGPVPRGGTALPGERISTSSGASQRSQQSPA